MALQDLPASLDKHVPLYSFVCQGFSGLTGLTEKSFRYTAYTHSLSRILSIARMVFSFVPKAVRRK